MNNCCDFGYSSYYTGSDQSLLDEFPLKRENPINFLKRERSIHFVSHETLFQLTEDGPVFKKKKIERIHQAFPHLPLKTQEELATILLPNTLVNTQMLSWEPTFLDSQSLEERSTDESTLTDTPSSARLCDVSWVAEATLQDVEKDLNQSYLPTIDPVSREALKNSLESLIQHESRLNWNGVFTNEIRVICYPASFTNSDVQYLLTGEKVYRVAKKNLIGQGGSGEVYALENIKEAQASHAIKLLKSGNREWARFLENECFLLEEIHKNSSAFIGIMQPPHLLKSYLKASSEQVMGYIAPKYDEQNYMNYLETERLNLSLSEKIFQMAQLLSGLNTLQKKTIIHGDIKSENVLIDKKNPGRVKLFLSDFGGSALEANVKVSTRFVVTLARVIQPDAEALFSLVKATDLSAFSQRKEYIDLRRAMDGFALGEILFALFRSKEADFLPYPKTKENAYQQPNKIDQPRDYLFQRLEAPSAIKELILQMLEIDYHKRISVAEAFKEFTQLLPQYPEVIAMLRKEGWEESFLDR